MAIKYQDILKRLQTTFSTKFVVLENKSNFFGSFPKNIYFCKNYLK
jgi:hypothetical protein